MTTTKEKTNFFYFIKEGEWLLCDLEFCAKSENTIDITFFELANNEKLVQKLNLLYLKGSWGNRVTDKERPEFFAGYLQAFVPEDNGMREKLITNPTIRLLVTNPKLLAEIKNVLCQS